MRPTRNFTRPRTRASELRGNLEAIALTSSTVTTQVSAHCGTVDTVPETDCTYALVERRVASLEAAERSQQNVDDDIGK